MNPGRLLLPALRWDRDHGFDHLDGPVDALLELGAGGFILFGGDAESVARLTATLRERAGRPLLVGADLERGAGQQFSGTTTLPPALALGEMDDREVVRTAGRVTAQEALALGVNWLFAPVADLDAEPANPIVGTRAFGEDPERVSSHVDAWIEGARAAGALTCAKHFPGHGRTVADSHLELPVVAADRAQLDGDLLPFRSAIRAAVDAVMTAHVAYPALDPSGTPATLSRPIITGLLREELGFAGLVITDALIMEGVRGGGESRAAVAALAAGCDVLAYPREPRETLAAVRRALDGTLDPDRVGDAIRRIELAAARAEEALPAAPGTPPATEEHAAWASDIAFAAVSVLRGEPSCGRAVDLLVVDDDVGGPFPHSIPRDVFARALREAGVQVREVTRPGDGSGPLVALYADIKGFKGRPGLSPDAGSRLEGIVDGTVVLFGHPRMARELDAANVLCAWGGEPVMQGAAARWLTG